MKIRELSQTMFVRGEDQVARLEMLGKNLSDKTLSQKRRLLDLIVGRFGEEDIESIPSAKIVKYLFSLDLSRSSSWKNHYLQVFKELYGEYVWRTGLEILVPNFPRFSNSSKKADVFSTEELNLFFNSALWENEAEFLLFYVTVNCGLRMGEARGLKAKQFNFRKHILLVDGFIRFDGSRTNFNKSGSIREKKIRVVFLPTELERKIKSYFKRNDFSAEDYIFTKNGKPFRAEFCDRLFKKMLDRSLIEAKGRKLTPHSLRYTYVTRMRRYLNGEVVRLLVGHTSQEMTDYYTKPLIEDMIKQIAESREAAEKIFS